MRATAGLLLAVALLLGACGGAGSPPSQPGAPTPAPAASSPGGTPAPDMTDEYDYDY